MCIPVLVVARQMATLASTPTQQSQSAASDRSRPAPACMSKFKALHETRAHVQTRVQVDVTGCVNTWQVTGNLLCQQLPCPATHLVQGWLGAAGAGLEYGQSSLADHPHQAAPMLLLGAVPNILDPHQLRKDSNTVGEILANLLCLAPTKLGWQHAEHAALSEMLCTASDSSLKEYGTGCKHSAQSKPTDLLL